MLVNLNCRTFEYDVHSLIKAFYPDEDVIFTEGEADGAEYISITADPVLVPAPEENLFYTGQIITTFHDADNNITEAVGIAEHVTRAELKNIAKRTLYSLLGKVTGRRLPWGTLTGIRPTKIPMALLFAGADDPAIREYMQNTYLCSDEKITLATDIARRENAILSQVTGYRAKNDYAAGVSGCEGKSGYSLYIGIPFCPTRCLYCSFTSYPIVSYRKRVEEYLNCIKKELAYTREQFGGQNPDTIYIGGGTPTSLSAQELELLLSYVDEYFDVSKLLEYTLEAGRPDSITPEKLSVLKNHKVTRISVNPQTMNQATLDLIGRRHKVEDVIASFEMARTAGFDNINMDIILGLPGEDEDMVRHTLSEIEKLKPDSLTVHSMAIKRAAGMHQFLMEHPEIESTNTDDMMAMTAECAARLNLKPYYLYRQKNMAGNYENVGYAREGKYGIYNILIMEEIHSIVACGAGCVTKRVYPKAADGSVRIERCDTVKDVNMYITQIDEMIERKRRLFA